MESKEEGITASHTKEKNSFAFEKITPVSLYQQGTMDKCFEGIPTRDTGYTPSCFAYSNKAARAACAA